jgi:hypothetical protein
LQRNFCTCESLGYQYEWQKLLKRKEESMPMNLPEESENDRATVKYHYYTDIKNSCYIAVYFVP